MECVTTCPGPGLVVTYWKFLLNLTFCYSYLCHRNETMVEIRLNDELVHGILACMDCIRFEKFGKVYKVLQPTLVSPICYFNIY